MRTYSEKWKREYDDYRAEKEKRKAESQSAWSDTEMSEWSDTEMSSS
jgi:hypothetical protein